MQGVDYLNKSRTYLTKLNAKASVINRIITLICNFTVRSVFIKVLGNEYLGLGGMFGNVFSVLSLCELGFGEAAFQSLYKPIAEGNERQISAIVSYYAKIYRYISLVTLSLSVALLPLLPHLFKDITKIDNYRLIYLLFVVHQILSYHFAPKRALVMCDQRMYAIMAIRTVGTVVLSALQIFTLLRTGNYLVYILLRIFISALDGIAVSRYAGRTYGFLSYYKKSEVSKEYKDGVWGNTRSLILHRIGGVINTSTDSILISSRLGLSSMGIFSNYSLIINSIGSFISLAVNSASASVGNLGATASASKSERVLRNICFTNFVLMTCCSAVLLSLINPIITLWIGEDMCFSMPETAIIIACFYASYIRDPVQIFIKNYGVFRSTRFIYLARGILNLVLSIIFVDRFGVTGVFAGTLASTMLIAFPLEPYMLFRHGFNLSPAGFLKTYTGYVLVSTVVCALSYFCTAGMPSENIFEIALRGICVLLISSAVLICMYFRTEELSALRKLIFRSKAVSRT